MSKYTDDQIFEKLKEILGICCPDLSIDTVTNLNFIMIMSKVEAAFDIRVPDADWDRLSTAQDVIDKVQEQLALKA